MRRATRATTGCGRRGPTRRAGPYGPRAAAPSRHGAGATARAGGCGRGGGSMAGAGRVPRTGVRPAGEFPLPAPEHARVVREALGDPVGVEVLEEGLRVAARGGELVAQARQRD